jgi:hypothetical protein
MDPLRTIAEDDGFFTRGQALEAGHNDRSIARAIRSKLWVRIRHGSYTFPDLWSTLDEFARHRVTARTVLRRLGPAVALSHTSALVEHGAELWGVDLRLVHVTRLDGGAGRREAGVQHHEGFLIQDDLVEIEDGLATSPARAAVECGLMHNTEVAVVAFDSSLRAQLTTPDELRAAGTMLGSWPGAQHLQVALRLADGRSGSVGESRARYLMFVHKLPAPLLQYEVYDRDGELIGICDFGWPEHRALGEFDGKVKYGRLLRPGEEPGDAVFREKRREDAMRRATQFAMIRIVWTDLRQGRATAAEVRSMLFRDAA